jgi:hypothetical protein
MRNADDCNDMELFNLADEGATLSFVKATQSNSREGAKEQER